MALSEKKFNVIIDENQTELTGLQHAQFKIGQTLELCYKMVGFPKDKYPVAEEAKLICANIIKYFGSLNHKEILYAFELSVHGSIHVNLEHYHTIGVKYIASILRSYCKYKSNKLIKISKKLNSFHEENTFNYLKFCTKNDLVLKKLILSNYVKFLKDKTYNPKNLMTPNCYNFIFFCGWINYSDKKKQMFKEKAKSINSVENIVIKLASSQYDNTVSRAMNIAVYDFFEIIMKKGVSWISLGRRLLNVCFIPSNHDFKIKEAKEKDNLRNNG